MFYYILRRMISVVVMLFLITATTFMLFYASPIDPARYTCGKNCTPTILEGNRVALGYDQPVAVQYGKFVAGLVVGRDFPDNEALREANPEQVVHCAAPCLGYSPSQHRTINEMVGEAWPVSVSIAVGAFVLWILVGVGGGIIAALTKGRWPDRAIVGAALTGFSLPTFFVGLILLTFPAIKWGWVPIPDYVPFHESPIAWAQNLVLPWITLAFFYAASYVRLTRAYMIETLSEDYIRTAKAKGVRRSRVVFRHGLRATTTPLVTAAGLDLGGLLGGAIITESVFSMHGLGFLAVRSVTNMDLPTIVAMVMIVSAFVVIANMIVDVLYGFIDPRVKVA
ncbi:ABC transporter permease [Tessaracoccus palaemonis]|uniref:ABC transporter permease n=1 Tax=Tessaracoccus palaemonis TaxID=2829499 RepID=A0ABX8SN75_9ACTN|nr:ABC transporter permease [Tessaracoccus palaemonis]QXT63857.1 ABC transporter permease [Tessaracoccus palaemonis]